VLLLVAGTAIWIRWERLKHGHYFWQPAPVVAPVPVPTAPAAAGEPAK
jgi:hypothetical protein